MPVSIIYITVDTGDTSAACLLVPLAIVNVIVVSAEMGSVISVCLLSSPLNCSVCMKCHSYQMGRLIILCLTDFTVTYCSRLM